MTNISPNTQNYALSKLYGKDKNGKIKEWFIYVKDMGDYSHIICQYGGLNEKLIENTRRVEHGKNIGKKNQTTHFEQACLEAESKWRKKKERECYTEFLESLDNNYSGGSGSSGGSGGSDTSNQILLPMLAQDYKKHSAKIRFPCYTQPKLDGYRAVCINGKMYSRQGKEFEITRNYFSNLINEEYVLDGELYSHNLKFEELGILRKKPSKLTESEKDVLSQIEYHIYDVIIKDTTFEHRLKILESLKIRFAGETNIKIVETQVCQSKQDIEMEYQKVIQQGYEGLMLRNAHGLYQCKNRSYDLQKFKEFMDSEFKIVGYTKEQGDLIVWICETTTQQKFNVQSKGTREERKILYQEGQNYIGKMLWVQFFEYTADGIPRFPKTMRSGKESIREFVL